MPDALPEAVLDGLVAFSGIKPALIKCKALIYLFCKALIVIFFNMDWIFSFISMGCVPCHGCWLTDCVFVRS